MTIHILVEHVEASQNREPYFSFSSPALESMGETLIEGIDETS